MVYLKNFKLLNEKQEEFCLDDRRIFNNHYPLGIFPPKKFEEIHFEPITIFYGGNGSGKTTLLNVIGNKINAQRKTAIEKGTFFNNYVNLCHYDMSYEEPEEIKFISSDDVFDYLLDIRAINANVNRRKNTLTKEFLNNKYNSEDFSIEEHEALKDKYDSRHKTMSAYIRNRLMNNNIVEQSNGESALMFWEQDIKENGIYILDEPENSLSAENQLKLKTFIEDSARFYNCQFIISTHSPFLLNLNEALIYDLDEIPVKTKKWNKLENVKIYYNFFKKNEKDFEE